MNTLTGEPILDFVMQTGVVGLALFLMYRMMMKSLDKKGGDTQMMVNAVRSFEAIEQRLNSHDGLLKHIMETQNQMLRIMERQMTLLEQFGTYIHGSDAKLDELKADMAALQHSITAKQPRGRAS